MSSHDPFAGDGDRTIIKPMPGGRRGAPSPDQGPRQPPPPPRPASEQTGTDSLALSGVGRNGLVSAAAPLFALVPQLRSTVSHADPASLQAHVAQEITAFEARARQAGEPSESVLAARYAACTLLDETVLSTPWGVESSWSNQTLLVRFHNEARGGEKFFQILDRLLENPGRNLNLLEFMYVCLTMGFEGRYRLQPRGRTELENVQQRVFETIRSYRGEPERELSIHWRGVQDQRPKLAQYLPLWVLVAIGGGLSILVYVALLFSLNAGSDPVVERIAGLAREPTAIEVRAPAPVVQTVTLSDVLNDDPQVAPALTEGLMQVEEGGDRARVRLWSLFPSGEAVVSDEHAALVERVARALAQFPGGVLVVGHTDDEPIRSLRFPSNWILSERRAESVNGLLARFIPPQRLSSEGRADTQPLVANDSAVNRALNRRVEISLFYEASEL